MKHAPKPRVLVELFTSQGCSSCPPADEYLRELAADPNVIPLTFHVDYWNRLGWVDPFSSPRWSERQRDYARRLRSDSIYTPQLVIHGTHHEVGSDRDGVRLALNLARDGSRPKGAALHVSAATTPAAVVVSAGLAGGAAKMPSVRSLPSGPQDAQLLVILYERHLTTDVPAGENRNRTLQHDYVVRDLEAVPAGVNVQHDVDFTLDPEWQVQRLGVVALVQSQHDGTVLAVERVQEPLPPAN